MEGKYDNRLYYNISELYLAMENYERTEIYNAKLDALAHELNDSLYMAHAKKNIGLIYFLHYKDYAQALENVNKAYRYYFTHPEEGEKKAVILNILSEIYLNGYNDDRRAEEYASQALQISDTFDSPFSKAAALHLLSAVRLKRGEWRKSEQLALQALDADCTELTNTLYLYENLAKAYAKLGESDKAWEYFDKSHALQASWSNRLYQSVLTEMEVKYETEKKELQISALEGEKQLMIWLSLAGGALLLAAFFFL
ncbi:MAG: hypothetical protein LBT78_06605 [Tannerella sp.]|jgi:tetratricopeptide (TPR) repeat protein|nr:hypothetical protein [Tannerella sp.]